ncbi:hypothetical protein WMY93_016584 [Mugilogobius chulae]|uniref:Uncharacterized protein n=1 Tax=Mugilogobius chulae TaxID=88201 RepID=A0AAW0NWS7_9GOBI
MPSSARTSAADRGREPGLQRHFPPGRSLRQPQRQQTRLSVNKTRHQSTRPRATGSDKHTDRSQLHVAAPDPLFLALSGRHGARGERLTSHWFPGKPGVAMALAPQPLMR